MERHCDVLIVGGGLNGPALALALASGGLSSVVIDAQPRARRAAPEFDGRAYALALSSRRMLAALGLWRDLAAQAQAINDIKISDGRAGEGAAPWHLHFDRNEIDEGPMGHFLEDRYLRGALLDAIDGSALIEHRSETEAVAQAPGPGGIAVTLGDGSRLRAALLVGCDGRGSRVAARAGIARLGWEYRQSALVCAVEHELPHHGIAHQFFMPPGPLAILPLPGNRSSIVWTEARDRAAVIAGLEREAYLAALRPRFGDFLGGIRLAGARFGYPLGLSLAESFTAERVALAGDAAHGIHPLAGQGLNLGLRDVAALAEVLVEAHRRGLDIGAPDVLAGYQRWRRFDTAMLVAATDGLNRLFSNDNPLLRLGRDLGLGLVNRLPALRRGLIREAAGLAGDLPKLLLGRPI
ncbi:MAG TPA: FAD-dependent monooxygenase [Amaricoccus sp.]|uniref:FAD-dependent monooxygenase n=1 Tax=Amaricoccus sp. TaxID=1872485 RepID=UPI002BBE9EE3|nr:FAD-dependent monooxygenase [Amaricoccus sp.]HMQ93259.1 FAD-dependent monooxygenase [Amaricoccus sp.]HMR54217.1 FAD-dependent monooxygenase [Amaricoccus sp.]HMR60734.1 FAD-dependent monooxygenase [Amaricoccus sp.]HMU01177.1 FAD-dependent monooxygenase [Amaricoccus sp.]